MATREKDGLLERLEDGNVICAEGYLFEFERRGYLQAGAFVTEVVLEHPELVTQLHREFVHAGSDVVEAFTYYAHREKLRLIGKEHLLQEINQGALSIAKEVAYQADAGPERQAAQPQPHGAVSRKAYPTPRTVWINRGSPSASVLRRR